MSWFWLEIINTDKQTGHFECLGNVKLLNDFVVCSADLLIKVNI